MLATLPFLTQAQLSENPPHANYARKGMKEIFFRVITRMNDEQLGRRE